VTDPPRPTREQRAAAARRALEVLSPLGPVEARPMFGGHGVFLDGAMVALVASAELYLKTDDVNRHLFEAEGLAPFVHRRPGRVVEMSYRRAPEPAEDWDRLAPFAESAEAAARRALAARPERRQRRRRPPGPPPA
jgi:DNA transformation protein and related proteins